MLEKVSELFLIFLCARIHAKSCFCTKLRLDLKFIKQI